MTKGGDLPFGSSAADSAGVPWTGRDLKSNPFTGDDGSADPDLARAVARFAGDDATANLEAVVDSLADARVLVPILAQLEVGGSGDFGEVVDKEASSGVVALEAPDGRRALPIFSSVAAMSAWRDDARPVPTQCTRAALSAVSEDWALLVLDPAGPHPVLVPRPAVWAIARGQRWHPAVRDGVVDQEVADGIAAALGDVPHLDRVDFEAGRRAELAVVASIRAGLDRAGLNRVLCELNSALAACDVVSERVDSVELRVAPAR